MNGALQQLIQSLEDDASLLNEDQLHRRLQVLDVLDAHFATELSPLRSDAEDRVALRERAEELSGRLEAVNATLYAGIRSEIQRGNGAAALLQWVSSGTAAQVGREPVKGVGYDSLDELIRGVFAFEQPCSPPSAMHPEMVFYQPTPARHIFRLVELTALTGDDVLVDLGSGLGHVTLLVSVCTAARSVGVELEASYLACARQCAQRLHLRGVSFLQQDARSADLSTGTVFYLHTPFTGTMMRCVLDRLRSEASTRSIRVCTYGPCTAVVAAEPWLQAVTGTDPDQIAVFTSRV